MQNKSGFRKTVLVTLIFTIIISFLSVSVSAQSEDIILGKKKIIKSQVLNEEREIMVYTPPGYKNPATQFPVLYLLDGKAHFLHASGVSEFLSKNGLIPQMVVVAINNIDRSRDFSPTATKEIKTSGGAEKFLQFLEEELLPYIEKNYHVSPYRTIMGHSFGGTFVAYALLTKPGLFNATIAISPYLQYDDNYVVKLAAANLKPDYGKSLSFYMTIGDEPGYISALEEFAELMETKTGKTMNFKYTVMNSENHNTIPHISMLNGLTYLFSDWKLPPVALKGGIKAVDSHYKKVSEKYGLTVKSPERTINFLGYTYMNNKDLPKAIKTFKENVKRFPESANVYDSLGEAYEKNNELDLALKNYKKAVEIGKLNSNPNINIYSANLNRVQKLAEK